MGSPRPRLTADEKARKLMEAGRECYENTGLAGSRPPPDALMLAVFEQQEARARTIRDTLKIDTSWTVCMTKQENRRVFLISRITDTSHKLEEYTNLAVCGVMNNTPVCAIHAKSGTFIYVSYPRWQNIVFALLLLFLLINLLIHPIPSDQVIHLLDSGSGFLQALKGVLDSLTS